MLRRLRWIIAGFHHQKTLKHRLDAEPTLHTYKHKSQAIKRNNLRIIPAMEAVHEIAIYIHRFHNLDLFQQGWYQIKITMRWEDGDGSSVGTPSRVVQYEAPNLGPDDIDGVWRIDDTDHSFSSQTFRIRYARQDVLLSVMISFNLSLSKFEVPSTSAVILKFELIYAPVLEAGSDLQTSLDPNPAAVHEFRIPPKALLGLHSYCPVHFDIFHAVLVDTSVHISLLKGGVSTTSTSCTLGHVSKFMAILDIVQSILSLGKTDTDITLNHSYINSLMHPLKELAIKDDSVKLSVRIIVFIDRMIPRKYVENTHKFSHMSSTCNFVVNIVAGLEGGVAIRNNFYMFCV